MYLFCFQLPLNLPTEAETGAEKWVNKGKRRMLELSPVVEVAVGLRNFHNIDLHLRGYYHIRVKLKASSKHGTVKTEVQVPRSTAPHMFPATVVDGYAVGKTIEILYAEENVFLDDTMSFTVRLPQRIDKVPPWLEFLLVLELWFCEKDQIFKKSSNNELLEGFRCVSKREVALRMSLRQGLHHFRPILFDYFHLAAVTLLVHASLVSLDPKPHKKDKKNGRVSSRSQSLSRGESQGGPIARTGKTQIPEKMKTYHKTACMYLLAAYEALQLKTKSFARLLSPRFQIRIQMVDTVGKLEALCRRLCEEADPQQALDEDRQLLGQELRVLWTQFLDLFSGKEAIESVLAREHHSARAKRFAEGFFLSEDSLHGLIASSYSSSGQSLNFYTRLVELLKRSSYFSQLPQLATASAEMDGESNTMPVIFEEKFIHPAVCRKLSRLGSSGSGVGNSSIGASSKSRPRAGSSTNRLSPEKVVRALKTSLCLDLAHRHRPASMSSPDSERRFHSKLSQSQSTEQPPAESHLNGNSEPGSEPIHVNAIVLTENPNWADDPEPGPEDVDPFEPSPSSPLWASASVEPKVGHRSSEPNLVVDRARDLPYLETVVSLSKSDSDLLGSLFLSPDSVAPAFLPPPNLPVPPPPDRRDPPHSGPSPSQPQKEEKASLCCLPLCGTATPLCPDKSRSRNNPKDSSEEDSPPALPQSESFIGAQLTAGVDESVVEFVRAKEQFKERLSLAGYSGHLYSDFLRFPSYIPSYTGEFPSLEESTDVHLIVCVHGLDGSGVDLRPYKTYLRYGLPGEPLDFLMSEANQNETFNDFETMTKNFVDEILLHLSRSRPQPSRISFIGHSLGTIIIRSALSDPRLEPLLERLHCFLSLNGPHCGVLFNQKAVNWGMSFVQWWKGSKSLQQLALRDKAPEDLRETFLYNLSKQSGLESFKYILLVGSNQDMYVPCHSALIQTCKAAQRDSGPLGVVYGEMVSNLLESITGSGSKPTVVRYTAFHGLAGISRTHQVLGRAAHIAVLDDDLFIEKLLIVSALQYFA